MHPTPTPDPRVDLLAQIPQDLMSTAQAATCLSRSRQHVEQLIRTGQLEATAVTGRGTGRNMRYLVTKAAVLRYLVEHTTGDRSCLLASIASVFPQYLAVAQGAPMAPTAPNVIRMRSGMRRRAPITPAPAQGALYQSDLWDPAPQLPVHRGLMPRR